MIPDPLAGVSPQTKLGERTSANPDEDARVLRDVLVQAVNGNPVSVDDAWALLHAWDALVADRDDWMTRFAGLAAAFERRFKT